MEGIFGRASRIVAPPSLLGRGYSSRKSKSQDTHDRKPVEQALAAEGVHHELEVNEDNVVSPQALIQDLSSGRAPPHEVQGSENKISEGRSAQAKETETHHPPARQLTHPLDNNSRGHAHDPLQDTLYLDIGAGMERESGSEMCISESPTGTEDGIYEMAYREEMDKILERRGRAATMFLNRRVEHKSELRKHESMIDHARSATISAFGGGKSEGSSSSSGGGLAGLIQKAKEAARREEAESKEEESTTGSKDAAKPQDGSS